MRNVKQMRCTKQIGLFAFFLLPIIQPFTIQATANKQASTLQQTDEKRTGERLLSGNVTDKGNEPLIGVTVQINGMKRNAITNAEGRYRLYIPQGTCKVTFSYVGMKSQTISFNGGSESLQQNIVMHEDKQLDEVVVTGFYTRSKQTFTGAAKTYNGEELRGVSPTNILQALSVLDAGISITQNNAMGSNPNNLPDLVIRSTTSLATDNEAGLNTPLIVIDGVEQSLQALYDIDINDIERVDILKDDSATSHYC